MSSGTPSNQSHLSPAERALLVELGKRGVAGMDRIELKRRRTVKIADSLVEKGYLTATAHGRVVHPVALQAFQGQLQSALGSAGELHHREVAQIFGLSRGCVRDLLALLVKARTVVERGPTVVALAVGGSEKDAQS